MSLTPLPTLDQLAADPARVKDLPPEVAGDLLPGVAALHAALQVQAFGPAAWAQGNGQPEAPAPQEDRWLTPREAADLLGLTVEELTRRRNLPRKKLGHRTVRYSLSALKRYMATRGS